MDFCPWAQSMLSRDVNAATRLAEASWRRDNMWYMTCLACRLEDGIIYIIGETYVYPLLRFYWNGTKKKICPIKWRTNNGSTNRTNKRPKESHILHLSAIKKCARIFFNFGSRVPSDVYTKVFIRTRLVKHHEDEVQRRGPLRSAFAPSWMHTWVDHTENNNTWGWPWVLHLY